MKSIALNDSVHHDDEGFVIVDADFDSSLLLLHDRDSCSAGGDEDSYDHCEDAFSFSSLHQLLPASSLPTVQDDFFDPPVGQEVEILLPPVIPPSPSLLSGVAELDLAEREDVLSFPVDVGLSTPSDLGEIQELVTSPLKPSDDTNAAAQAKEGDAAPTVVVEGGAMAPEISRLADPIVAEIALVTSDPSAEAPFTSSQEEDGCTTASSSSSEHNVATTSTDDDGDEAGTDDGEDEALSSGSDGKSDDNNTATVVTATSRLSKKKRSKQLRLAKKAAAAAALGQFTLRSPTKRKLRSKGRNKKVANIAVSCAVQSLADYKDEIERSNKLLAKKALR